jgi:hypothetical protein
MTDSKPQPIDLTSGKSKSYCVSKEPPLKLNAMQTLSQP